MPDISDVPDVSDMPELETRHNQSKAEDSDDEKSIPELLTRPHDNSSSGSLIDLLADQKDSEDDNSKITGGGNFSEDTEGAKFIIHLEQTQTSLDNIDEDNMVPDQDKAKNNEADKRDNLTHRGREEKRGTHP